MSWIRANCDIGEVKIENKIGSRTEPNPDSKWAFKHERHKCTYKQAYFLDFLNKLADHYNLAASKCDFFRDFCYGV